MMDLKEKLVELRSRQGLTQGEVAAKINVSRQTIYKWERGIAVPSAENLIALGRLYGVPLEELADDSLPLTGQPAAVEEEPPMPEEAEAPPHEAVEEAEAPPRKRAGILKIWGAIGAVALTLLVAVASVITIVTAIKKEPERPEDKIVWTDDMVGEDIDLSQVIDGTGGTVTIEP